MHGVWTQASLLVNTLQKAEIDSTGVRNLFGVSRRPRKHIHIQTHVVREVLCCCWGAKGKAQPWVLWMPESTAPSQGRVERHHSRMRYAKISTMLLAEPAHKKFWSFLEKQLKTSQLRAHYISFSAVLLEATLVWSEDSLIASSVLNHGQACILVTIPSCFHAFTSMPQIPQIPTVANLQAIDRRERLRRLALETIDLSKDPYFMRNHLGQVKYLQTDLRRACLSSISIIRPIASLWPAYMELWRACCTRYYTDISLLGWDNFCLQYECRLCLTLHNNEGNYLAHTQVPAPFTLIPANDA